MAADERKKALDLAISQIEKSYGKGSIMKMGEASKMTVEAIPTGCLSLDLALGVGGLPKGRIIEIFGPEAGGKTTVSLHAIAEAQRRGGIAAFIDAEHALDPVYAKKIGVDINNMLISQPDYGEQAMEIVDTLVRSNAIDIIVIDSVAALVPKAEIEGEMGDVHMGLQARLMSQALRKLTAITAKSKTVVVFINQLREKIGVMFGNPETTPGGRALKFYSSVRLDVRAVEKIKDGDNIVGTRVRIKVVKNKVAPPFRQAMMVLTHGQGLSKEGELIELGSENGIIQKSGAWFAYEGEKLGQGFENTKQYLIEHKAITNKIETAVRKVIADQAPGAEPKKAPARSSEEKAK